MDTISGGGILNKLKDLNPELCTYFLENYFENETVPQSSFHTIPTALLRDQQTYTKGLLVLDIFLNYCTSECLNKAGTAWMTLLLKHVSLDMPFTCSIDVSYRLLGKIVSKCSDAKELAKTIATTFATRVVQNIVESPKVCQLAALQCLGVFLQHCGGACSPLQSHIEKFIVTFADAQDESLTIEAGRCLLLLQQLSGGGVQNVNHQKSWGRLQTRLLGSLSETLCMIFDEDSPSDVDISFPLAEIDLSAGPLKRIVDLVQRFKNLSTFFSVALLGAFRTTKPVQPVKILKLISKVVEAMGNTARNNLTLGDVVVVNVLPSMHESILGLLTALIALLRGNMVLFSRSICSILLTSLKCSAKSISLRIATYKIFVFWCNTVNASSCVEDISESFITSIIRDTRPFVVRVQLQVNGLSGKGKQSKRLKRKLGGSSEDTENEDMHQKHLNGEKYEQLCAEALKCLRQLIRCGCCFMKLHEMKRIYEHTTKLILQNVEIDRKKRPLYANHECRRNLLLVLKELLVTSYTIAMPQSQFLIHVFSQAQHSEMWHENRMLCVEIVGDLERVIHPQKLELKFPPNDEAQPIKLNNNAQDDVSSDEEMMVPPEFSFAINQSIQNQIIDGDIEMTKEQNSYKDNDIEEIDEIAKKVTEPVQNEQECVHEIDSSDDAPNDIQELSDEEIVFMPVNGEKNQLIIGKSQSGTNCRQRSPILLDEDSNDEDVINLVNSFVDDVKQ